MVFSSSSAKQILDIQKSAEKQYSPSLMDIILKKGQFLAKTGGSYGDNAIYVIYQVPLGYTFFITGIELIGVTISPSAGEINTNSVMISQSATTFTGTLYIRLHMKKVANEISNLVFNPTIPLKLLQNEYILYKNEGASGDTHGQTTITGFLVQNELLV